MLFIKDFYSPIDLDNNRAVYGLLLRDTYISETGSGKEELADLGCCSVLEMLVALAISIDNDLMIDTYHPNRTAEWFWMMIDNLGLGSYDDYKYSYEAKEEISYIVDTFLERKYLYDGKGGLFPLKNPRTDQRMVEIWFQMQSYFYENMDRLEE